jgi:tetratricopeptide (TPR) repeat protein
MRRAQFAAALFALFFAPVAAGEASHDEILDAIEDCARRDEPAKVRALADDFLARFGEADADAPLVLLRGGEASFRLGEYDRAIRFFGRGLAREQDPGYQRAARTWLGLALAELSREEEALCELERAATPEALYALGQLRTRRGEAAAARAALERVAATNAGEALRKKVQRDLDDLAKIGKPAPPLAEAAAPTPTATVVVFERRAPGGTSPLAAELAAVIAARIVRIEVEGWDDARLEAWRVPALPRVYVLDAKGVLRAAGVRGKAIAAAVEEAMR